MTRLFLSALLLDLVLILPNHPGAMTWGALRLFPLELPVILALLAARPGPARAVRAVIVGLLTVLTIQKLADLATNTAFGRPFNIAVDAIMVDAGIRLGIGTLGLPLTVAAMAVLLGLILALAAAIWWATGVWAAFPRARGTGWVAAVAVVVAVAEIGWAMRAWTLPFDPPGAAFTARTGVEHLRDIALARRDLRAFRQAAMDDPAAAIAAPLSRLRGRDVIVVFLESYGRASLDNPLYAPTHRPILQGAEAALGRAGLAARTAWLTSPIEGGQSWLAHATLASGLPVPDQIRHAALIASPRRTLFRIAADAGWRTAAISPAITMAWPEGLRLGFETLIDREAMGYEGPAFNWITMPDQFTLARFRDRLPPDRRALFAQITLISSHAPWFPVPVPVPWEDVDNGQVFAPMVGGEPPEVIWQNPDRIRDQYRIAMAYSLEVTLDWAARQGPDGPLILILGDHPPVAFVSGVPGRDVPVHMIGPPDLLNLIGAWGWTPGLVARADTPVWPMQDLRDRFLSAFSDG